MASLDMRRLHITPFSDGRNPRRFPDAGEFERQVVAEFLIFNLVAC
jgi:hypothetical protein